MSVELMVEVLTYAPAELNPTERLTLVVIAESCRADTRMTYYRDGWDAGELARRVGIAAESLTKVFRSLANKGCEVRVAHATKDGKPVFAFKGKQTTFRLPRFAPQSPDESPGFTPRASHEAWTSVPQSLDESPGNGPQSPDESPPLLLKAFPSKNPSSLSPREDEVAPPPDDALEPERETDDASQKPVTIKTNPVHVLLVGAGCPEDLTEDMEEELRRRNNVRAPGPAWFRTVSGNGELRAHVTDALEAFVPAPQAGPLADAHPFEAKGDGSPDCKHCPFPEPNRRHKVANQSAGHFRQRDGGMNQKRSTGVMRAEQALRVAAQLDEFERNGGGYLPGSNIHHLVDSHSPNRDYSEPF